MTTCQVGVYDCQYPGHEDGKCADYDGEYFNPKGVLVYPVLTGIFMCMSAFGLGANDAANSWATSVSSGAIHLLPATVIAGICEFAGAVSLGYGVSGKIQSGVSSLQDESCWACGYCDSDMAVYQISMLAAQISTGVFLLLATFSSMPVSGTHAIIGSIVGTTITAVGGGCLNWKFEGGLGGIVASWVISPALSAIVGILCYIATRKGVIEFPSKRGGPQKAALNAFPALILFICFYMSFLILTKSLATKSIEISKQLIISTVVAVGGCACSVFVRNKVIYPRLPSHAVAKGYQDTMMVHAVNLVKRHSRTKLELSEAELKAAEKDSKSTTSSHADNNSADEEGRRVTVAEESFNCSVTGTGSSQSVTHNNTPNHSPMDSETGFTNTHKTCNNTGSLAAPGQMGTEPTTLAVALPEPPSLAAAWSQSVSFRTTDPATRDRIFSLTEIFGPEGVLQAEIDDHGAKMKESVEAQFTLNDMLDAGIEPEDIRDLKDPDRKDAIYVFRYLLVFNAALESFAHGANDTANSTTAFSASMQIYRKGRYDCSAPTTDWWIMAIGGGFVALGVYALGWRVIRTVGERLTSVNYHRGFCIEFASTVAVVIATILDIPVSTTHCQIGAVVGVGLIAFGRKRVDFSVLGLICLSWLITLPFAGLLSSGIMELIKVIYLN